jgi:hypothetical protein
MLPRGRLQRRRVQVAVDAVAAVGQGEQEDAAGSEQAQVGLDGPHRVLAVFETSGWSANSGYSARSCVVSR